MSINNFLYKCFISDNFNKDNTEQENIIRIHNYNFQIENSFMIAFNDLLAPKLSFKSVYLLHELIVRRYGSLDIEQYFPNLDNLQPHFDVVLNSLINYYKEIRVELNERNLVEPLQIEKYLEMKKENGLGVNHRRKVDIYLALLFKIIYSKNQNQEINITNSTYQRIKPLNYI